MTASIYTRYITVLLFVAVYITLGFVLKLEAVSYLLLGIPLMIVFQLLVAKQPLHKLWLRDEEKFRMSRTAPIIALCLIVYPVYRIIEMADAHKLTLLNFGYYAAAMAGAIGAGYCYSNFTKRTVKELLLCFAIVIVVRISLYFFPFITGRHEYNFDYIRGIRALLTYIPVAFALEEIIFRGMLDTYIHPSARTKNSWSALFISCLWGLWHLPLAVRDGVTLWSTVFSVMTISLWGIVLSISWRRSGNLAIPAFSHAVADAVRDGLM